MNWLILIVQLNVLTPIAATDTWAQCEQVLERIQIERPALALTCSPRETYEKWFDAQLDRLSQ